MQKKRLKSFLIIAFVPLFFVLLFLLLNYKNGDISSLSVFNLEKELISGINKTIDSVVQIVAEDKMLFYQETEINKLKSSIKEDSRLLEKGNGIIISELGYIITNKHVVDNEELNYKVVLTNGKIFPVKKIWKDDLIDIAIIYIQNKSEQLKKAEFIDINEKIDIGQFVSVVGNALSKYINTVSFGIISGKGRNIDIENNKSYYAGLYQTDAAINPGNSGGPMINLSGNVVGIVTATSIAGNNIGFAIPISQEFINAILKQIKKEDNIIRPYIGIKYTNLTNGARIDSILNNSPIKGILQPGDIILEVDKRKLSLDLPFLYHLYIYNPGDTIIFTVDRGNKKISIPIII